MRVQTKAYGPLDVDERQRLDFPKGLLGFERYVAFVLIDAPQKPFLILQSLEAPELAFVLIDPFLFRPDYTIDVGDRELASIGLARPEDALVFAIVTVPAEAGTVTANLMGPVIVNRANRKGMQAVLTDPRWQVKHDIVAELAAKQG